MVIFIICESQFSKRFSVVHSLGVFRYFLHSHGSHDKLFPEHYLLLPHSKSITEKAARSHSEKFIKNCLFCPFSVLQPHICFTDLPGTERGARIKILLGNMY